MRNPYFLSLLLLLPAACHAQVINNSVTFTNPGDLRQQTNNPVSLVIEHEFTKTLADGTHITTVTQENFYRDSLGRTRMESMNLPFAGGLPSAALHSVTVIDPVAHVRLFWLAGEERGPKRPQTYNRIAVPAPQPVANSRPLTPPSSVPALQRAPVPRSERPMPKVTREDLGATAVQGESCQALRVTTVFPVDFFGNDRPLTQVVESCFSRELGRDILGQMDDPRSGLHTSMLQSVSHAEPDPALFQPPPGYTDQAQQ